MTEQEGQTERVLQRFSAVALALGVLAGLVAVTSVFLAIWVHGTDAPPRFIGTAFVSAVLAAALTVIGFTLGGTP